MYNIAGFGIGSRTPQLPEAQDLKTPDIVAATNGTAYVRRGAQKLPIQDEDALARLRLDKGLESFE